MASAQRTQARFPLQVSAQLIRPRARGVDDNLCLDFYLSFRFARSVTQDRAADLSVLSPQQGIDAGVVEGLRAVRNGFTQEAQDEAGVVRVGVEIAVAAAQRGCGQWRAQAAHVVGVV